MPKKLPEKTCVAPGCANGITANARTNVCVDHKHIPDLCNCRRCITAREALMAAVEETLREPWVPEIPAWCATT